MNGIMGEKQKVTIDLAVILRWLARLGLNEAVDNDFSFMVPGTNDRFLINPHRRLWQDIRSSELVEVNEEGQLVEGAEPPEVAAFYIRIWMHPNCKHEGAILQTHMPYATA